MARSVNEVTLRLCMNESVDDLEQRLGALNPDAVSKLVLRNCLIGDVEKLCKQIRRCVGLRCLSCVACPLSPSKLTKLVLAPLQHLEILELSLVEDSEAAALLEMNNVARMVSEMQGVNVTHTLRRVYVEVGGDHNFELLRELLKSWRNLTELHVHLVQGTFSNALTECCSLHADLAQLEAFTFTSELPPSIPFAYEQEPSSPFTNCATICANVRYRKSDDSWSCVELGHELLSSPERARNPPSQLVVFAVSDFTGGVLR
ncbi:hypothetical protein MTO96_039380 [Rhipicephalus appendiculatus]